MALTRIGPSYYSKVQKKNFSAGPGNAYFKTDDGTVVERPDATSAGVQDLLSRGGLSQYEPKINEFAKALGLSMPSPDLYRPVDPDTFSDEAREGVSEYWDKDLDILLKEIGYSHKKLKEETDKANTRLTEDKGNYFRIEDKSFAKTLENAQLGFSGRGTFDSGFRMGAIGDRIDVREEELDASNLGYDRNFADIADNMRLGTEEITLRDEREKLRIERGRKEDEERRKAQLAAEQNEKNQQIYQDQFSELLQQLS